MRAHWGVLGTVAIFTELVGSVVLPTARTSQGQVLTWIVAALTAVSFVTTLLLHECAHAAMAHRCGVAVDRITLWMLGGATELAEDPPTPRKDALIAAAGPAAGIGIVCETAAVLLDNPVLRAATGWLGALTVVVSLFNLLPGSPLDGGRIVYAVIWARTGDRNAALRGTVRAGRVLGTALVAAGVLLVVVSGAFDGVWVVAIGLFLGGTAGQQEHASTLVRLRGLVARDAMVLAPQSAPEWWTVAQSLNWLGPNPERHRVIPLIDLGGAPADAITVPELLRIPQARRSTTRLSVLPRHTRALLARPMTPLSEVAAGLSRTAPTAVVVEDGRPLGLITTATLVHIAQTATPHASASNSRTPE